MFSRFLMLCLNAPWKALLFENCAGGGGAAVEGMSLSEKWGGWGGRGRVPATRKHGIRSVFMLEHPSQVLLLCPAHCGVFLFGLAGASAMASTFGFFARH